MEAKLLMNQLVNKEIKKEKKYMETNENKNATLQNLCDIVKTILRGKYLAIQVFLKKQGKAQINNITLHLKKIEKENKVQSKQKDGNKKDLKRNKWHGEKKK